MVHTLKFGSLSLNNEPVTPETEYHSGQLISFGPTVPGKEISWVPVNGLLIADQCLLTNISWDDLDAQGLVFGKEIKAQGFRFKIRLLKVGSDKDAPNEWNAALDAVGEDDDLWHWQDELFWGQESVSLYGSSLDTARAFRGYSSARYWNWGNSSISYGNIGFRPALEPLPTDASDHRRGQAVMAIGRDGCVVGELVDETQYDFIIQPEANGIVGAASFATRIQDDFVAVDRSRILCIPTS